MHIQDHCPTINCTVVVPVTDVWLTQLSGPRPGLTSMEARRYARTLRCPACEDLHTQPTLAPVAARLMLAGARTITRPAELDDPKRRVTRGSGHRPQPRLSIDDVITLDHDLAHLELWGMA